MIDVYGEQHERGGDQLLRATLCSLRSRAPSRHQPQHHDAGSRLDQAVGAEADERDRPRDDARAQRNSGLDQMPTEAEACKQPRTPDQALTVSTSRRLPDAGENRQRGTRAHADNATGGANGIRTRDLLRAKGEPGTAPGARIARKQWGIRALRACGTRRQIARN